MNLLGTLGLAAILLSGAAQQAPRPNESTRQPPPPDGLRRVTAGELQDEIAANAAVTAVLFWDEADRTCGGCQNLLQLAAHPPEGMRVLAVSLAHFSRNSNRGVVNPSVNSALEERVLAATRSAGLPEALMAYPDSTAADIDAFMAALGVKGALNIPMALFIGADGKPMGSRINQLEFSVAEFAGQGLAAPTITVDPPTRPLVADFVKAQTSDGVMKLWATLAGQLARLVQGPTLLTPKDPNSLIDSDPKEGRWSVVITDSSGTFHLPATITGTRKGSVVAVRSIAPR